MTTAGPIHVSRPIVMSFTSVELTPRKQLSSTVTLPEMTTCEEMKTLSPTVEWCPTWLPLHSTQLRPTRTNGCRVLSSKTKQCSPSSTLGHTNARLET